MLAISSHNSHRSTAVGLQLVPFSRPLPWGRPPNLNSHNTELSPKVIQTLLHSFLYNECHIFHKILLNTIEYKHKLLSLLC